MNNLDDASSTGIKRRGRPKGSKNKSMYEPAAKKPNKSLRERAEEAATFNLDDNPEMCPLCFFRFNDPIKKDKIVTRCIQCQVLVHEMCLVKSGCDCELN